MNVYFVSKKCHNFISNIGNQLDMYDFATKTPCDADISRNYDTVKSHINPSQFLTHQLNSNKEREPYSRGDIKINIWNDEHTITVAHNLAHKPVRY